MTVFVLKRHQISYKVMSETLVVFAIGDLGSFVLNFLLLRLFNMSFCNLFCKTKLNFPYFALHSVEISHLLLSYPMITNVEKKD